MDSDDEFLGTLLHRNAKGIFFSDFCRHAVMGLTAKEVTSNSIRHDAVIGVMDEPKIASPGSPVYPESCKLHPCARCGSRFFWESPRGDTFCYCCRPPKRRSPAFVRRRLIIDDSGQVDDFDELLAASESGHSDATELTVDRPRRGKGRAGARLGPPPHMTIDAWWDSLIEPADYDSIAATCEAHRASDERRAASAAERELRLAAKAGRGAKAGVAMNANGPHEKNLALTDGDD